MFQQMEERRQVARVLSGCLGLIFIIVILALLFVSTQDSSVQAPTATPTPTSAPLPEVVATTMSVETFFMMVEEAHFDIVTHQGRMSEESAMS